jgi:hypothetical protein
VRKARWGRIRQRTVAVDGVTLDEPAAEETTLNEPAVDEPTVHEPTLEASTLKEPTVKEPTVDRLTANKADMAVGDAAKPRMAGVLTQGPRPGSTYRRRESPGSRIAASPGLPASNVRAVTFIWGSAPR